MKSTLHTITLPSFETASGFTLDILLSYETFGPELRTAPIVLINHALTGNSSVSGRDGWWKTLVGENKVIDTNRFTVLCFNIPGNGYDKFFIQNYQELKTVDIAELFVIGLRKLKIHKLHSIIGGSIGGSIGWEMLVTNPFITKQFIPIACDYKTTDWLNAQCIVQEFLLDSHYEPLQKARIHAMLCYRTPNSINQRFNLATKEGSETLQSYAWLNFHGKTLNDRFSLTSYRLMNQLLKTINGDPQEVKNSDCDIHFVAIDSDLFFLAFEMRKHYEEIYAKRKNVYYHEIKSIHGHDAFLMEYEQLTNILQPLFA